MRVEKIEKKKFYNNDAFQKFKHLLIQRWLQITSFMNQIFSGYLVANFFLRVRLICGLDVH